MISASRSPLTRSSFASTFVWSVGWTFVRAVLLAVALAALFGFLGTAFGGTAFAQPVAVPPKAASASTTIRRFALVASSNDGGPSRARLRFADSDAHTVADVLESLGGLRREDLTVVTAATRASLEAAFTQMRGTLARAAGPHVRRELFVYYSGHSDEEGLLLGAERVGYGDLRHWIDAAGADVRIAILDSCASGALIRLRGGSRRPSFLSDASTDARGHAFLTASSADEAAQESDRIGAAFFTHYLVSGLRGAADTSRDGKVTLNEAYQFAYHETLRRTERTAAGAQHPAYDIQLAGTGDLVMTDVRSTAAGLVLDEKVAGRVFVRDMEGRLLVEVRKEPLYPIELGLGAGRYVVVLDADGRPYEAQVVLVDGQRTRLAMEQFGPVSPLVATRRGDEPLVGPPATTVAATGAPPEAFHHVPFEMVLAPGIGTGAHDRGPVLNNFVLGIVGHSGALDGFQLSLAGNMTDDWMHGTQLSPGFNLARGSVRGAQIAGGVNLALDRMVGAQVAGALNIALGDVRGVQISNGNYARHDVQGAQLGVANFAGGGVRGAQISVANFAGGGVRGAQVGTVAVSGGESRGLQAGVVDAAQAIQGAQIAVVNVGGEVTGTQIGVVNVAKHVRGLQLGVVNVGESVDGASVGLLNFIGDGYHRLTLWSSDVLPTNIGYKLGSKYFYALGGFGVGRADGGRTLMGAHVGLGGRVVPFGGKFFFDIDAVGTSYGTSSDWDSDANFSSARLMFGYQIMEHLAIIAGPTYNVDVRKTADTATRPGLGWFEHTIHSGSYEIRQFPGFVAGLQI